MMRTFSESEKLQGHPAGKCEIGGDQFVGDVVRFDVGDQARGNDLQAVALARFCKLIIGPCLLVGLQPLPGFRENCFSRRSRGRKRSSAKMGLPGADHSCRCRSCARQCDQAGTGLGFKCSGASSSFCVPCTGMDLNGPW